MRDTENTPRSQFPSGVRGGGRTAGPGSIGRMPVNERSYRRPVDPPCAPELEPTAGRDEESPGYVIHLPIKVTDLAAATSLAGRVATSLNFLPELDAGETEVSTADDQNNRRRVFCDLPLPDRTRCPQPYDHRGPCGEVPTAPEPRPANEPTGGP